MKRHSSSSSAESSMKRVHVTVSGMVQGVFFRAHAQRIARSLCLAGWVRNRSDGGVEAVFEGKEADVRAMIEWCRQGPPTSFVSDVALYDEPYTGEFADFTIRR